MPVRAKRAPALQPLDGAGLLGAGVLDRLRFVDHRQTPVRLRDPWQAQQRAVTGDYQVHVFQSRPARSAFNSAAGIAD